MRDWKFVKFSSSAKKIIRNEAVSFNRGKFYYFITYCSIYLWFFFSLSLSCFFIFCLEIENKIDAQVMKAWKDSASHSPETREWSRVKWMDTYIRVSVQSLSRGIGKNRDKNENYKSRAAFGKFSLCLSYIIENCSFGDPLKIDLARR